MIDLKFSAKHLPLLQTKIFEQQVQQFGPTTEKKKKKKPISYKQPIPKAELCSDNNKNILEIIPGIYPSILGRGQLQSFHV